MNKASGKIINYYELLEIDAQASSAEIKQAYRNKLKQWHPDKNLDRLDEAEETTKILNQAFYTLNDPDRRRQYDRVLRYTRGKDFDKVLDATAFWKKVEKASPVLRQILENLKNLYGLFVDSVKGKYYLHPAIIGLIGGGLLYFIIPLDLIPDYIPVVGLLDDYVVLSAIINSLQTELADYQAWKDGIQQSTS
jgi:uncharacterized membrane protein YkvA (DUF1232 family)